MSSIELSQTQRYYHFICLKGSKSIIKKAFYNSWQIKETQKFNLDSNCFLYQMKMTSDYQYYRGEVDNSLNGNNKAPYLFDIILIDFIKLGIVILGFPYKKMTIDLVSSLVGEFDVLKNSNFIKIDMSKIINSFDVHTDILYNQNHFLLGGIFLVNTGGSKSVSTVKLVGDKPLDSELYKNYFKKNLKEKSLWRLDKCILKCTTEINQNSSIHIDKFGNYKLYIQINCKSVPSLPVIFEFLDSINSFIETPNNPVSHILDEE